MQRYACVDIIPFPWDEVELVMLIRAYGGCLGTRADETRDKLRKASGRGKYPLIRRFLNGETYLSKPQVS